MNSSNDHLDHSESLDTAVNMLLNTPVPADFADRVKAQALELDEEPKVLSPARHQQKRSVVFRYAGILAMAGAVACAFMSTLSSSSSELFAEVIASVKRSAGVEFKFRAKSGERNAEQIVGKMLVHGRKIRLEDHTEGRGKLVQIRDQDTRKILMFSDELKRAQYLDMSEDMAKRFANPIEQICNLNSNGATEIGEEFIEGRLTHVFEVAKPTLFNLGDSDAEMTLWSDAETSLPVKAVVRWPESEREIVYDGFQWNALVADDLFAKPSGYAMGELIAIATDKDAPAYKKVDNEQLQAGVLSHQRVPCSIGWSRDGSKLTGLLRDSETKRSNRAPNQIVQWDVASGEVIWTHEVQGGNQIALSGDGTKLALAIPVADAGSKIQLRNVTTGEVEKEWRTEQRISAVEFSSDGRSVAGAVSDWDNDVGGVRVWSLDGELKHSIRDESPTTHLAFSADGEFIASSSNSPPGKIWKIDGEKTNLTRVIPTTAEFDFSPDGKHFACMPGKPVNGDTWDVLKKRYDVQVYDFRTGKLVQTLKSDHTDESWVTHICYSPDGERIATANWDSEVRVWDVATGKLLQAITEHTAGVLVVEFSPDGKLLATGGEDMTLRLWKLR